MNISSLVKLSPTVANTIQVTWAADFTRAYVLSVFMVRKLTSAELLQRLKNKGTKNPDYTRSLSKSFVMVMLKYLQVSLCYSE